MLDKIHSKDEDGKMLRTLQNYDQFWQTLDADIGDKVESYQKEMKAIHKVKKNAIQYCTKELRGEELASE